MVWFIWSSACFATFRRLVQPPCRDWKDGYGGIQERSETFFPLIGELQNHGQVLRCRGFICQPPALLGYSVMPYCTETNLYDRSFVGDDEFNLLLCTFKDEPFHAKDKNHFLKPIINRRSEVEHQWMKDIFVAYSQSKNHLMLHNIVKDWGRPTFVSTMWS